MDPYAALIQPFIEFGFMRRALVACFALGLGCGPVGVLLVVRRMSLVGDALSHAVLPGAAIGFMIAGLSLVVMSLGGFIAGLAVAVLSGLVARVTPQREDASFAAFYLISLALGVLIVSSGSNVDLMHVLFGTILAVDDASVVLVVSIATTLVVLAIIGRGLVNQCYDPGFFRAVGGPVPLCTSHFNAGCHEPCRRLSCPWDAMAVGLMMLPAAAAILGLPGHDTRSDEQRHRLRGRLCRTFALLLRQSAVRPGHHPGRRRGLHRLGCRRPGVAVGAVRARRHLEPETHRRPDMYRISRRFSCCTCHVRRRHNFPSRAADKLNVVTTFTILGDAKCRRGALVSPRCRPNGDAHVYEPTPADARVLAEADLVLVNDLVPKAGSTPRQGRI